MERRLREQVAAFPHRRLFVAYSGGLDSTALLHCAVSAGLAPTAIHVNHGLHPQSGAWQRHGVSFCEGLGVAIETRRVQAEGGEAGFREARYAAFDALIGAGDLLLLGHHRTDQAETVLMRLMQGREPLAMPRVRRLRGGGRTLKPWLSLTREELARYARWANLHWIEDPSNAETAFDRNLLRHRILPMLAERWPDVERSLAAFGESHIVRDELLAYLVSARGATTPQGSDAAPQSSTAVPRGSDSAPQGSDSIPKGRNPPVREAGRGPGTRPPVADRTRPVEAGAGDAHDDGVIHTRIDLNVYPTEFRMVVLRHWLRGLGEYSATNRALGEFVRQLDSPADRAPRLALQRGQLGRHGTWVVYEVSGF